MVHFNTQNTLIMALHTCYCYILFTVDAAIANHITQLQQQVTDAKAEVSRLQANVDEMRRDGEQQTAAVVDSERQKIHDEFTARLETVTQQRE